MTHFLKDLEFVSQRRGRQDDEYSCGVASFKMLLKYCINKKPKHLTILPTYGQLCKELHNSIPAQEKTYIDKNVLDEYVPDDKTYGAYQEDMIMYLKKMKIPFEMTRFIPFYKENDKTVIDNKEKRLSGLLKLIERNIPVMVEIGWPQVEFGHWLVLRGYIQNGNKMYLYDPYKVKPLMHEKAWNKKDFLKSWDGISLCISIT